MKQTLSITLLLLLGTTCLQAAAVSPAPQPPIPVTFTLDKPGRVTLVLEDETGVRVRNLLAAEPFDAGTHTVYWDGLDEGTPRTSPGVPGYQIQRAVVAPGTYRVRGLVRDELTLAYELTILPNTKHTPWPTDAGKKEGGWLGDHGNPSATLFLPAARAPGGVDQMLLANSVNEAGHGLAWVDLHGNKLAGQRHFGGHWTGASHLAYDHGKEAHPEIYAYGRIDWSSKVEGKSQLRLTGMTENGDMAVAKPDIVNEWDGGNPGDLTVHNGLLVASAFGPDRLIFFDTRNVSANQEATLLGEMELEKPQALAFDRQGRLLAISGERLLRYTVGEFPPPLSSPEIVIDAGLDEPRDLAVDDNGLIYVAQWGQSHQVKVFTTDGKLVRTIGKPGGPRTGPYDPQRMAFPYGLSIDSGGNLWVAARRWWVPKAIYVWTEEGQHVRNHYGPAAYGGGGTFDPVDPTRFLYHNGKGGMEFKVDWEAGTAEPVSIYHLPFGPVNDRFDQRVEFFKLSGGMGGNVATPYRARGRKYISNGFSGPTSGPGILMLLGDRSPQAASPLLMLGKVGNYEKQLQKLGLWDQFPFTTFNHPGRRFSGAQKTLFLWADNNRDGEVQADEFQFHLPQILVGDPAKNEGRFKDDWIMQGSGIITTVELGHDLDVLIRSADGRETPGLVLRLRPTRVDADGMPHYDLTTAQPIATNSYPQRDVCSNILSLEEGRMVLTGGPIQGYKNGKLVWIYHSQWPSLHSGHAGPRFPEYPGQLIATTRVLGPGFTPDAGEAGELWALNSDLGLAYLFTADGLFVDTLFEYTKYGRRWNFLEHERGMDMTDVNYLGECFEPTIAKLSDGRVVMQAGKAHSSIVQVHGLDSIRRISGKPVSVQREEVIKILQYARDLSAWEQAQQEVKPFVVRKCGATPSIDGDFAEWDEPAWITIQRERLGAGFGGRDVDYTVAAGSYDATHLYIALRSRAKGVLQNEGGKLEHLFKTGGGLDIHLSTHAGDENRKQAVEGDVRLLVTLVDGKVTAARYRPVVSGTQNPIIYDSPVSETRIDRVDDVSERIHVAVKRVSLPDGRDKANFEQIEAAIPLSVLGWDPANLPVTRGDIGILVGKAGATTQRIYWQNKAAGLVSDIPSEARLEPSMWGKWRVEE